MIDRDSAFHNPDVRTWARRFAQQELANKPDLREDLFDHLVEQGYPKEEADQLVAHWDDMYYEGEPS